MLGWTITKSKHVKRQVNANLSTTRPQVNVRFEGVHGYSDILELHGNTLSPTPVFQPDSPQIFLLVMLVRLCIISNVIIQHVNEPFRTTKFLRHLLVTSENNDAIFLNNISSILLHNLRTRPLHNRRL